MAQQNLTNKERLAALETRVHDDIKVSKAERQEIKKDVKNVEGGIWDLLVVVTRIETKMDDHVSEAKNGKTSRKVQVGWLGGGLGTFGFAFGGFAKAMGWL